jgi:hypothetical protein
VDDGLNAILMRFPGPVTLAPSRRKWALIFVGCSLAAAGGLWMVKTEAPWGWYVLIVFLIGAIIAGAALLPVAGGLTLDSAGFEVKNLFRRHRVRWQDVTGFKAAIIPPSGAKFVVYDEVKAKGRAIANFNTAITGRNAALPDTYGFSAGDLASIWADGTSGRRLRPIVREPRTQSCPARHEPGSFDHLVSQQLHRDRHLDPKRLRSLHVDDQLELGRSHDRKIGRLFSPENPTDNDGSLVVRFPNLGPIAHQAAGGGEFPILEHRGNRIASRQLSNLIKAVGK